MAEQIYKRLTDEQMKISEFRVPGGDTDEKVEWG